VGDYCIMCGERLEGGHRYCSACGSERWARPAPDPTLAAAPAAAKAPPAATPVSRIVVWLFAAGAVLWLVNLAQTAGILAASAGRAQIADQIRQAGYTGQAAEAVFVFYVAFSIALSVLAAALHGAAYYGLRDRKRWGWLAAVLVAGAWSLVLVGIPLLAMLLRRSTRQAYGIS
jgi:hypothetical protein